MNTVVFILTLICALGCGLIAGVFFAFSAFIMKALAKLPPSQGLAAMQSINVVVINPWFIIAFFGTAVVCLVLSLLALFRWEMPGAAYLIVGSALYLIGTILVTILCNVPRNNTLAVLDPTSADSAFVWRNYLSSWTMWNHVRTMAAFAAAACHTLALAR